MLFRPVSAVILLGSAATAAAGHRPRTQINDKQFRKELFGKSKRSSTMRKKFISKATFVGGRRLQNSNYYDWYNSNYDQDNANDNNQYQDNNQAAENGYNAEGENEQQAVNYGFLPSQYALSYHRCANVQQFDDEVAARADSNGVLATKSFAVFRLCPVATCDGENEGGENRARKLQDEDVAEGEEEYGQYQQDQGALYGARGSGCQKDYGEYMMDLEDYLQIMNEFQEESVEEYCLFCEDYMYQIYWNCMNNGGCRRDLKFEEFKDPDSFHSRMLAIDYGSCVNYPDACNGALDNDNELTQYFECAEANGVYVGPHCAADGFTVTLGVYGDDECNEFIGGDVTDYIGGDYDDGDDDGGDGNYGEVDYRNEDVLKRWYNSRHGTLDMVFEGEEDMLCIPCSNQGEESYGFDEFEEEEDEEGDVNAEISELCESLVQSSAHCHKNFQGYNKNNLSDRQGEEMQLSCDYIESIVSGNYDEMGYINLASNWNVNSEKSPEWLRDNMYAQEYARKASDVTPLQVFFLIFGILACIILATWSKTLHTSLTKKEPWSPRREWNVKNIFRKNDQPDIEPSDSGIGASRVRSDATSYYVT